MSDDEVFLLKGDETVKKDKLAAVSRQMAGHPLPPSKDPIDEETTEEFDTTDAVFFVSSRGFFFQ